MTATNRAPDQDVDEELDTEPSLEQELRSASLTDPVALATGRPPRVRGKVVFLVSATWLGLLVTLAIFADLLPLESFSRLALEPRLRPGFRLDEPLGSDALGRSNLSRAIYGARVSMAVGLGSAVLSMVIGGMIGLISGYFRGKVEAVLNIFLDTALAFPPLVLLLAFTAVMRQSLVTLALALTLLSIPSFARLARGATMSFAKREFVLAARAMGAGHRRVVLREILPNVVLPVASYAFVVIATLIVAEGSLSFLGLGIPPPQPSWGGMIANGRESISTDLHLVLVPAAFLLMTVFSLNVVGDKARRRFDRRASSL